jgi:hypothetical protein
MRIAAGTRLEPLDEGSTFGRLKSLVVTTR